MIVGVRIVLPFVLAVAAACAGRGTGSPAPGPDPVPAIYSLAGEVVLRSPPAPETGGYRFGGLSGIVALRNGRELLAVSDDEDNSRVVRLHIAPAPGWNVELAGTIALDTGGGAPARLDPEGIALTSEGHLLISSEGFGNQEPRLPPAIVEYSPDGRFIRQLHVRDRYRPNPSGPLVTGVPPNAGFESLTTSPDFARLFTATERPLTQDDWLNMFERGSMARILEYVRRDGSYQPAREFAYEIEPLEKPAYPVRFAINGLVEMLALSRTELLALERGFVESEDRARTLNRIRIFRISLEGASDISGLETLRGAAAVVPVRKALVADLNGLPGLSPALRGLDNFEGLAWGPAGPDGVRPLMVVSDDNFSERQMTAFLFLRPGG